MIHTRPANPLAIEAMKEFGLDISAARVNETLELRVEDDGPGFSPCVEGKGIGLANTRARLEHLYGEGATLRIDKGQRGGTAVTLSLPYHLCP